jgi:hypothetical protein
VKKLAIAILFIVCLCEPAYSQSKLYAPLWARGFFFDAGVQYNYQTLESEALTSRFNTDSLLFRAGAGYDFGLFSLKFYGDFGVHLTGYEGADPVAAYFDVSNIKLGVEAGIKVLDTRVVDLIIPLGFQCNWTAFTLKEPGYIISGANSYAYDSVWAFNYYNIYSGLDITVRLTDRLKLLIMGNIGYPVFQEFEYSQVLRGGYYWVDTGSAARGTKYGAETFSYSVGAGLRVNL